MAAKKTSKAPVKRAPAKRASGNRRRKTYARKKLWRWALRPLRWAAYLFAAICLWVASYTVIDPPGGFYMASEWVRLGKIERDWRDLDQMAPHVPHAVMAAEDANFCLHWGFDLKAIGNALASNAEGRRVRGASTITQQVAKNLFLWHGRSWVRKGLEAGFALLIETIWSKRRIVEVYLNVAEFDEGVFGIQAAARRYFTQNASGLSLTQAARLAAILPDPKGRNAAAGTDFMRRRAMAITDGAQTLAADGRDECLK